MKKLFHFRSRVFRRIFLVILGCALLPIGGLIALTYYNVQSQLTADTAKRLHHASKNIGMAVIARFNDIEASLEQVARNQLSASGDHQAPKLATGLDKNTFISVRLFPADGTEFHRHFSLSKSQQERIKQNEAVIVEVDKEMETEIWLAKPVQNDTGQHVVACGQVNLEALLEFVLVFVPTDAEVAVVNKSMRRLFSSGLMPDINYAMLDNENTSMHQYAEVEHNDEEWLVGNWSVFLRASYAADSWHVLIYEPKEKIFSSLYQFARNAGLTSAMAFWIILLVSSILVRKILFPLQTLQQATRLVGSGEYDCKIDVDSPDEFGDLSNSFNLMAEQIRTHLFQKEKMSKTINDVLGEIEQKEIVLKLLNGLEGLVKSEQVGFVVYSPAGKPNTKLWQATTKVGDITEKSLNLASNPADSARHQNAGESQFMTRDSLPQLFKLFNVRVSHYFILLPVNISSKSQGALIFAYQEQRLAPGEAAILNQLADQLGVALAKADMVDELDHLNFGILTALARSVDAHSKWTQGHSERVTRYALAIAEELGFDEESLADVHRAGLLHDLGKISIPAEILNKTEKLTSAERALISEHPSVAGRILEPIRVFDKIRPAVEQHHELWDGSGYPLGLQGEEIDPIARVLTVADVYDALYSDRPYREGWSQDRVFEHLVENSGHLFDPKVVDALFRAINKLDPLPAGWAKTLNKAVI